MKRYEGNIKRERHKDKRKWGYKERKKERVNILKIPVESRNIEEQGKEKERKERMREKTK